MKPANPDPAEEELLSAGFMTETKGPTAPGCCVHMGAWQSRWQAGCPHAWGLVLHEARAAFPDRFPVSEPKPEPEKK